MHRTLLLLLFLLPITQAQVINEIMYDLSGADTSREWIEIYNNGTDPINLSDWKFFEADTNHAINFVSGSGVINQSDFAVIADNSASFLLDWPGFSGNLFDSSFSLSNTGETLVTRNSSLNIIENITYDTSIGGVDGSTLCRYPDGNETFSNCSATPGALNNQTTSNSTVVVSVSSCDLSAVILTNSLVFDQGQAVDYDIFVNDTACNGTQHSAFVEYSIKDLFGNFQILSNTTQTLTCSKTIGRQWTPSSVTGSEAYIIEANITNPGCNETLNGNNFASQTIVVKGAQPQTGSSINITKVNAGSDNKVRFGEAFNVDLDVYKGDTGKYAIDVYVKDNFGIKISEVSTFHANSKFTFYTLSVPVQMKTNCDGSVQNGDYVVVAEGLDVSATGTVTAEDTLSSTCKTITAPSSNSGNSGGGGGGSSSTTSSTLFTKYEILDYKNSVKVEEEFITRVRITNNYTVSKKFGVYSYAYEGSTPVSLGYDHASDEWKATYTANKVEAVINSKSSQEIDLRNKIEEDTVPGIYKFRARFNVDGKDSDITNDIEVLEPAPKPPEAESLQKEEPIEKDKETSETESRITVPPATGFVAFRPTNFAFLSPMAIFFNFISALLNR